MELFRQLWGLDAACCEELSRSRAATEGSCSARELDRWVEAKRARPRLRTRRIPLRDLDSWSLDPTTGTIGHASGRFFSVTGLKVRHRAGAREMEWDQPILEQPEFGILGLLAKSIEGVAHFCVQAKEEPGNLHGIQLSPSLQATYSNCRAFHGGRTPTFLDDFAEPPPDALIFAKLQPEDGGRFLFKSNRNMAVRAPAGLELPGDDFLWLTLGQIGSLLRRDDLVHACARSVLAAFAAGPWRRAAAGPRSDLLRRVGRTLQWLDGEKAANHIVARRTGLDTLDEWSLDAEGFLAHRSGRFFRVVGIEVVGEGREVACWGQPIVENPRQGIIGLLGKVHEGERYYLMQAKAEVGNRPVVQVGPTVQFTPGNYLGNEQLPRPFLFEEFQRPRAFRVVYERTQSEEGGRFYRESHLHRILELDEGQDLAPPPQFRWLSESEIQVLLTAGETVNSCARSILACLLAVEPGS